MAVDIFKVKNRNDDLIESFVHAEDAAQCVARHSIGARIEWRNKVLWREGYEKQFASESFDNVAQVVYERQNAYAVISAIPA